MRLDAIALRSIEDRDHAVQLLLLGTRNKQDILASQFKAANDALPEGGAEYFARVQELHETADELGEELQMLKELLPPIAGIAA
ncbi:MAG: hypothetical protein AAFW60_02870 [Pseudomonadota bacterium]